MILEGTKGIYDIDVIPAPLIDDEQVMSHVNDGSGVIR